MSNISGIVADMTAKNIMAIQVLEDCVTGDNSDFNNSQDVLNYIDLKENNLNLK